MDTKLQCLRRKQRAIHQHITTYSTFSYSLIVLKLLLASRYECCSRYTYGSSMQLHAERGKIDTTPVERAYGEELEDGTLVFLALSVASELQYCAYLILDLTGRDHCCDQVQMYGWHHTSIHLCGREFCGQRHTGICITSLLWHLWHSLGHCCDPWACCDNVSRTAVILS